MTCIYSPCSTPPRFNICYIHLSAQIRGGYVRLWTQYVEQIPIPAASPAQRKSVVELADRILVAKRRSARADLAEWEREIDTIAYKLYDLTPEEITLVEGASPKKEVVA